MNRQAKLLALVLVGLIAFVLLAGCTGTQRHEIPNYIMYVDYNNKIYQGKLQNTLDQSASVGKKICDVDKETSCYKINNVDTNKMIAIKNEDYYFCEGNYICENSFIWKNKTYKFSDESLAAVQNNNSQDSNCKLGKSLGKVGNLNIFENAIKSSKETFVVEPDGLTGLFGKDAYFLATAQ